MTSLASMVPPRPGGKSPISRIVSCGTGGYSPSVARRLMILNGANLAALVSHLAFAAWFLAIDRYALWPVVLSVTAGAALALPTWLFHRVNDQAAVWYFCSYIAFIFVIHGHLIGADAGSHYYMLTAPALLILFGTGAVAAQLVFSAVFLGVFFHVEFFAPSASPLPPDLVAINKAICIVGSSAIIAGVVYYALRLAEVAEGELQKEYGRSELLLHNLMPASVAQRLKHQPHEIIAEQFDDVTILFADIVDFTARSSGSTPAELVQFLNRVFTEFDDLAERYGLEKIKTIGDAYMVAGGLPVRRSGHAAAVANMALDMVAAMDRFGSATNEKVSLRVGIHTGAAVAGVIGTRKLFYDVWGDTVNTASRMESHGSAGEIQVTGEVRRALADGFIFVRRGLVDVKGKGPMELFYLTGRSAG